MPYIPTEWKNGDIITAEKLNHIENGVASVAQGGVFRINAKGSQDFSILDKTFREIKNAFDHDMFPYIASTESYGEQYMTYIVPVMNIGHTEEMGFYVAMLNPGEYYANTEDDYLVLGGPTPSGYLDVAPAQLVTFTGEDTVVPLTLAPGVELDSPMPEDYLVMINGEAIYSSQMDVYMVEHGDIVYMVGQQTNQQSGTGFELVFTAVDFSTTSPTAVPGEYAVAVYKLENSDENDDGL